MGGKAKAGLKNQPVEVRIIAQRCQIVIVLRTNAERRLQIQCPLKRLQRQVERPKTRTSRRQTVMNVRSFRFTFQCSLKHFLRGYIFAAIQLDYTAII